MCEKSDVTSINRNNRSVFVIETLCFLCSRRRVLKYGFQKSRADVQNFYFVIICHFLSYKNCD